MTNISTITVQPRGGKAIQHSFTFKNCGNHDATKHIDTRMIFAREIVEQKRAVIDYCPTDEMVADCLTKELPKALFEKFRDRIGVRDLSVIDWD